MLGSSYEAVRQRWVDTFINVNDINENGQITPRADLADDFLHFQKFTHALEELGGRGGIPTDTSADLRAIFDGYFAHGEPLGLQTLRAYARPNGPFLVKYSRFQFLEETYRLGRLRISPASSYAAQIHNYAVRDAELERPVVVPTFRERLRGETEFLYEGRVIRYGADDLIIPVVVPDFYIYCLSAAIYYRLPTDFDADAALVIRDPKQFIFRIKQAFRKARPGYRAVSGEVLYYDPYTDHRNLSQPQMTKHLRYAYQREHRIAFVPDRHATLPDQPIFLDIGSMTDYADLLRF
jgi:hypothetical protein